MKEQDIYNRLNILFQQLHVIDIDEKSFIEKEGKIGLRKRIDNILDEINELRRKLRDKDFYKN